MHNLCMKSQKQRLFVLSDRLGGGITLYTFPQLCRKDRMSGRPERAIATELKSLGFADSQGC